MRGWSLTAQPLRGPAGLGTPASAARSWRNGRIRGAVHPICGLAGLAAAWIVLLAALAWGQQPPAESSSSTFRRVFVPQDALEAHIRGLIPLKRAEFERRVREVPGEQSLAQPPAAELVRIHLRARVEGQALRDGVAELELRQQGPQPAVVSLEPWNLGLRSALWTTPTRKPAVVGRDPAGRLCCLVPHSGVLELAWSQSAREARDDQLQFELALPPAPQRQIDLMMPPGWSLAAASGLVRRQSSAEGSDGERWTVDLGGEPRLRLVVQRPGGVASRPCVWRESSRYTLYRGTFDLEATWQWESPQGSASGAEVRFGLPTGLRVVALRVGEQAATWSVQTDTAGGPPHLVVTLPPEAPAGTLTITASGDWPSQGTFALPRIVPREGVYQEGQVELFSEPWLQVQPKVARGGVRVATSPTAQAGWRGLDRFAMQLFEPDAQIEVTASPSFAPLNVTSATQLLVETSQVLAVATAEVTVPIGERFSLQAQVPRPWVVDAVDVQPPEMLAERSLTAQGGGPQHLRLQLARPLVAGRPLRVTLRAHFRRPPAGQPLAEGFLQPLGFPDAHSIKRYIAVRVDDTAAELRLDHDERFTRLEEKDLSPAERQLFEQPPAGLLLATSDPTASALISLEAATARYSAETLLRVEVGRRQVQHTLKLTCVPEGASLGSVLVRLVPPPKENVTWHLADDARELTAIPEPAVSSASSPAAEVWRVPLPRPRNGPLELTAQWTSPLGATHDVPLVSLPDATLTTALVEVHARDSTLTMQTRHLEPLPPVPPEPGRYSTLVGRFRYAAGQQPQLIVTRTTPRPDDLRGWVESLWLNSRYSGDGRGEHEAQIVVRSAGRDELRLVLPPEAEEPSWHVAPTDPSEAGATSPQNAPPATLATSGEMVIPLPPLKARSTVVLRYRTTHRGLAHWPWRSWQVPLPSVDLPVLKRGWTVVLPSEFSVWSYQGRPGGGRAVPLSQPLPAHRSPPTTPDKRDNIQEKNQKRQHLETLWTVLLGPGWLAEALEGLVALPSATPDPQFSGWQQFTLPLPDGPQAEVTVYRMSWAVAWAWAWSIAAAAWGWRRNGRFSITLGLAFLAFALATLNHTPYTWWLFGAGCGALAGGLCGLAWPRGSRAGRPITERHSGNHPPEETGKSSVKPQPVFPSGLLWLGWTIGLPVGLGLAGLWVWAERLAAQDNLPGAAAISRVVVPVDDQGQPAGDYVYLHPGLYERLLTQGGQQRGGLPPWVVTKARYEVAPVPAAGDTGNDGGVIPIPHMRVWLELETFKPAVHVVMPWRQEEVTLHPGQSLLDGQPTTLSWEPDGSGLAITIPERGRHQLVLTLATRARRVGEVVQLDLSVPPAAIEEWVEGPDDSRGTLAAEAPATGSTSRGPFISLGPGRVRWRWPADPEQTVSALVEAEQLLWWKIRRGSVSLEARFRVRGLRPGPRTLLVEVDPRLRLVSGWSQGPIRRVRSEAATPHLVEVESEVPASGELAWQMTWLWSQASGSGRLSLPKVRLGQMRVMRDWTAVSVEPPLEWVRPATGKPTPAGKSQAAAAERAVRAQASPAQSDGMSNEPDLAEASGPLGTPTPAAFLTAWGEPEAPPLAVFATTAPELDEPLAIQPALPSPSADLELDWSLGASSAKLVLRAKLQDALGRLDYRLTWPAPVRVQRVVLLQGGRPAALRWTQPAEGTLLVTLLDPPASDAELHVEGTVALPASRTRWTLPLVRLDDVRVGETRVRLFRRSAVLLDLAAATGWEALAEGPVGSFHSERGWLVAALRRADARARPLQVERKSHHPKLSGHLWMRVQPQADGWQAQALLDLQVQDGFLDELRLSVPVAFSRQLRLEPAWESRLEPSALASRRLWIVRPPVSVTGKVQVTLWGRVDPGAGGIVVPDVSLPDAPQVARWVLLEPGTSDEPIVWQPRGLVAVRSQEVPAAAPDWRTAQGQWFRVVGRRFEATARLRPQKDASPRCLVAEYTVAPVAGGHVATQATFTLLPADARPLVLALPPGQRLLQVLVDGVAATPVAVGPRRWQIAAPSDVLPYQLTVLVDGQEHTAPAPQPRRTWPLPELVDLPAAAWLITVHGPWAEKTVGAAGGRLQVESAQVCSADEAVLVKAQTLARCLEEVSSAQSRDVPGKIVSQALRRWLTPLEQALAALPPTLRSQDQQPSADQESVQARLESVRQLVATLKTRSGLAETALGDAAASQPPPAAAAPGSLAASPLDFDGVMPAQAADPATPTIHLYSPTPGTGTPLVVWLPAAAERSVPSALIPRDPRAMLAALWLAGGLLTTGLALWPAAALWLVRHQPLVLMLASVAWWLAAPWGWLGWLGLLAAVWRAWRDRAAGVRPEPLSAISRSTGQLRRAGG